MDIWGKARSFAQEAAKRSQELTMEAAKKSQELTAAIGSSNFSDIVSETTKRSKELAAEASKRADQIKAEALKRADQIKSLSIMDSTNIPSLSPGTENLVSAEELEKFGVTDELREFVKEITMNTFQDFPMPDDAPMSDVPTISNVRQDLSQWQEKHATLVLLTVKEISKLRYELCPRIMRERKFWRIYFMLVHSHVAPYEKRYTEEQIKSAEQEKDEKARETAGSCNVSEVDRMETKRLSKTTSTSEQDLDVFLLGDGDSDDGPDDGDDRFDDFDKIDESSEDDRVKGSKVGK